MKLPIDLQSSEQILIRVKRHIVFLLTKLGRVVVFGLIPIIAALVIISQAGSTVQLLLLGFIIIWGLVWLSAGYLIWYRYTHDEWIITNQRLIDSMKKNWFHQEVASADLISIEDMSVSKNGVLQTMFNYGSLHCQTAGEQSNFILSGIPNPTGILAQVDEARDRARTELYQKRGAVPGQSAPTPASSQPQSQPPQQ